MTKLEDFLSGKQILEEVDSPFNGRLVVQKELAWGTHIMAGGITQSGGIAQDIWKTTFRRFGQRDFNNVLIIGFGGGGIAKLINKNWKNAKITGVEIDAVIVDLGNKYLGLNKIPADVFIADGIKFVKLLTMKKNKFDLICVDTYVGDQFPQEFEKVKFLKNILKILDKNGVAIFNRLYYKEKINQAHQFKIKLEEVFPYVEEVRPEANIMFICSSS